MALKQLVEKRNELAAKQKKLADVLAEANSDPTGNSRELDLSLIKSIEGTNADKLAAIRKLNEELDALGIEVDELAVVETAEKNLAEAHEVKGGKDVERRFPKDDNGEIKGFGDLFVESEIYKNLNMNSQQHKGGGEMKDGLLPLLKTTFSTGAGWAPESLRTGKIVEEALRPIQVIDTIPGGTTGSAAIAYMEETTVTDTAAERAEAGAYAEATLALTARTSTVRSIGISLPVTDEQLEDEPQVRSYLNMRLPFLVRRRLDTALLTGTGAAPILLGLNNLVGVLTQALAGDNVPDAVYKAMVQIRVTGRAMPNVVYVHPTDWQGVRLLRTDDGLYVWGNPSEAGPMRLWGIPVVETDAQTVTTALVGDTMFCQLFIRRNVTVEIGLDTADFTMGIQTIRCGLRAAFVGYRPAGFCVVSGL